MGDDPAHPHSDVSSIRKLQSKIRNRMARYPAALLEFFIKHLTDESDVILDFFAGSNTTGCIAEALHRRWLALENVEDYLKASKFRFEEIKNYPDVNK